MKDHIIKPMVLGLIDFLKNDVADTEEDNKMERFCDFVINKSLKETNVSNT